MLKQVPTVKTPIAIPDLAKSLIKFWQKTYSALPSKETIISMVAQFCHESGSGSHCYNYNLCNIKARDNANMVVEYMALRGTWEIIDGKRVEVPPTNPSSWFRSFPTLDAGAEFYCNFLRNSSRYKLAWAQVEVGDPIQFVQELHKAGYFTDLPDRYTKGVMNYYNKYINDPAIDAIFVSMQPKPVAPVIPSPGLAGKVVSVFSNLFKK